MGLNTPIAATTTEGKNMKAYEIVTTEAGFASTHLIRAENKKAAIAAVAKTDSKPVVYSVELPADTICDNDTL